MEKKHIIIIAILVIIIAILASAILLGGNPLQQADSNVISISSDDNAMSGKLSIIEWSDVKANENGTFNITQFMSKYGGLEGTMNDIVIKDGKAEYTLRNDTDYFMVADYVIDIEPKHNDSDVTVNVEFLHNGESIVTSSNKVSYESCPVSFGLQAYSVNGTKLSDSDLNIDIPELKNAFESMNVI